MKIKRMLSLMLALLLLLPLALPAAADDLRSYTREAQLGYALEALGLFQGYSGTDLGLADAPTRTQALVMMLRLMGLEGGEALQMARAAVRWLAVSLPLRFVNLLLSQYYQHFA